MAQSTFLQGTDTRYEPTAYMRVQHRHESLSIMHAYHAGHIQDLHASCVMVAPEFEQDNASDFDESKRFQLNEAQQQAIQEEKDHPPPAPPVSPATPVQHAGNDIHTTFVEESGEIDEDEIQPPPATPATLIEGVDTLGFQVYQKIGEGLKDQLLAIARGERVLNLVGHSRGAVQCILVAHELERIQKTIQENSQLTNEELRTLILSSPKKGTNQTVRAMLEDELKSDAFLAALRTGFSKTNEEKLEVNIFGIDPVPGSAVLGVNLLAWVDQRFYTLPPIVNHCEIILQEHERSRAFEALLPRVEDPSKTNLNVTKVYGHHGTATGNPDTQTEEEIDGSKLENPNTGGVQMIALYRMADFLRNHGSVALGFHHNFPSTTAIVQKFKTYIGLQSDAERNNVKLAEYNEIEQHRGLYERFKHTTYATGRLHSNRDYWWSWLGYDQPDRNRQIHHGNGNDTDMSQIVPVGVPGFMNTEHATLHLKSLLTNSGDAPEQTLLNIIERIKEDPSRLKHAIEAQANELDRQEEVSISIRKSIQVIISDLTHTYLRNHISEAKQEDILKTLRAALTMPTVEGEDNARLNSMITELKTHLIQELSTAITARVTYHQDEVQALEEKMQTAAPEALPALYASVMSTLFDLHNMKTHLPLLRDAIPEDKHAEKALCHQAIDQLDKSFHMLSSAHEHMLTRATQTQQEQIHQLQQKDMHLWNTIEGKNQLLYAERINVRDARQHITHLTAELQKRDGRLNTLQTTVRELRAELKIHIREYENLQAALHAVGTRATQEQELSQQQLREHARKVTFSEESVAEKLEIIENLQIALKQQQVRITALLKEKRDLAHELETLRTETTASLRDHKKIIQERDVTIGEHECTIQQHEAIFASLGLTQDSNVPQYGLAFEILGGVIAAAGIAVATVALLAITLMGAGLTSGAALAAGVGLATAGFFSFRHGAEQEHQAALHKQAYLQAAT
jgi:hypothetical protein